MKQGMGFVPQDDIVHEQLTVSNSDPATRRKKRLECLVLLKTCFYCFFALLKKWPLSLVAMNARTSSELVWFSVGLVYMWMLLVMSVREFRQWSPFDNLS